jgi:hypothetical protein
LGASWTPIDDSFTIDTNAADANSGSSDAAETYTGVSWTANQSSEVTITGTAWASGAGTGYGVGVRMASGAITLYRLVINSAGDWELGSIVAGSFTFVASGTVTYASGAVLLLSAIGTSIAASYNSVALTGSPWTSSAIASGSPGIGHSSSTSAGGFIDSWTGKDGL